MTVLAAAVVAVVILPILTLTAYALAAFTRHARRRYRAGQLPTLSHRECADNSRPLAVIDVSPARAPRNGNTFDPRQVNP